MKEKHLWLALAIFSFSLIIFYLLAYFFFDFSFKFEEINLLEKNFKIPVKALKVWTLFLSPVFLGIIIKTFFHIRKYLKSEEIVEDLGIGLFFGIFFGLIFSILLSLMFIYILDIDILKGILISLSISYMIGFLIKIIISPEKLKIMYNALSPAIIFGTVLTFIDFSIGLIFGISIFLVNSFLIYIKKLISGKREKPKYGKP